MPLYVDSSALLKRYLEEGDSAAAEAYLLADPAWFSRRHTYVEVRRNLGRALVDEELVRIRGSFETDWRRTTIIELDEVTCRLAADISELTGLRTLDALHLGAATRLGVGLVTFLTFDIRRRRSSASSWWVRRLPGRRDRASAGDGPHTARCPCTASRRARVEVAPSWG